MPAGRSAKPTLLLLFSLLATSLADTCTPVDNCSCKWSNGTVTSLDDLGLKNGIKFKDESDQFGKDLFSWNPCYSFSEGDCSDVAVCQTDTDGKTTSFGTQDTASFDTEEFQGDNVLTISYQSPNGKASKVYLLCSDTDTQFQPLGILPGSDPPLSLNSVESPSCCPRAHVPGPSGSKGLSPGSILLIVSSVLIALYVIGGIVIQKFIRKKEGREVMPNSGFWTELPGYTKDGVAFLFGKCRRQ